MFWVCCECILGAAWMCHGCFVSCMRYGCVACVRGCVFDVLWMCYVCVKDIPWMFRDAFSVLRNDETHHTLSLMINTFRKWLKQSIHNVTLLRRHLRQHKWCMMPPFANELTGIQRPGVVFDDANM